MPLSGPALGVKLADLRKAGLVYLPHMAATYIHVNGKLAETGNAGDALSRPALVGPGVQGTGFGDFFGPWMELHNTVQTIMANTANNLEAAGATLVHICDVYSQEDTAAGGAMNTAWSGGALDPNDPVGSKPLEEPLPEPKLP